MSNNADFDALARELRALREDASETGRSQDAMLVVRLVRGLSPERWQAFCHTFPSSLWGALPLPSPQEAQLADVRADAQDPVSPEICPTAVDAALNAALFDSQLCRELLRVQRTGGDLSLLCTGLARRSAVCVGMGEAAVTRLEKQLVEVLRDHLEKCDSLGCLGEGRWAAIFPGMGQHRARRLSRHIQEAFAAQVKEFPPAGGMNAEDAAQCAIGMVCMSHSDNFTAQALLDKGQRALEAALRMDADFVYLDCPRRQEEKSSLVLSNEKRFLFCGK